MLYCQPELALLHHTDPELFFAPLGCPIDFCLPRSSFFPVQPCTQVPWPALLWFLWETHRHFTVKPAQWLTPYVFITSINTCMVVRSIKNKTNAVRWRISSKSTMGNLNKVPQSVKCLPCKPENLSLLQRMHALKQPGLIAWTCSLGLQRQRLGWGGGVPGNCWLTSVAYWEKSNLLLDSESTKQTKTNF